jgi:hypothetical protein
VKLSEYDAAISNDAQVMALAIFQRMNFYKKELEQMT